MATTTDDIELGSDKGGGSQHGYPACPVASPKEQWQQWEDQKEQQTVRFAIVCPATTGWRGLRVFRVFAWFAAIGLLIWEVVEKLTKASMGLPGVLVCIHLAAPASDWQRLALHCPHAERY
jgi:hypothetical protein